MLRANECSHITATRIHIAGIVIQYCWHWLK